MTPVLHMSKVRKAYQGLRPLRIDDLMVADGERVAISGLDAAASEVLVNLVTGASVPDEGEVRIDGRSTASIASGEEWLASLDRFGIVSPRAVLLEGSTVLQNLAMPFTLQIDPIEAAVADRVRALAAEAGIDPAWLPRQAGDAPPDVRARAHLARAVALGPSLLVLEHPTAALPAAASAAFGADVARLAGERRLATLIITEDRTFAARVAHRVFALQAATGRLVRG